MFKTALALLAGSIILIGAIRRVQTIGTAEFVVTVRVTVFLFAAFAIGLFVVDADTAVTLASQLVPGREHTDQGISWMTLLFFSLLPVVYRIVEGARFTEAWKHAFDGLLVCLLVLIATILVHNVGESALGVQAMQALWLVGGAVVLGFAHAVFGPVLAAFNLSLIVASVIGVGVDLRGERSVIGDHPQPVGPWNRIPPALPCGDDHQRASISTTPSRTDAQ